MNYGDTSHDVQQDLTYSVFESAALCRLLAVAGFKDAAREFASNVSTYVPDVSRKIHGFIQAVVGSLDDRRRGK
jgi:hypothetical protein